MEKWAFLYFIGGLVNDAIFLQMNLTTDSKALKILICTFLHEIKTLFKMFFSNMRNNCVKMLGAKKKLHVVSFKNVGFENFREEI